MKKVCPLCNKELKDNDIVVFLGLAKITFKENAYDLALMAQTISSHLYCAEAKSVIAEEVK